MTSPTRPPIKTSHPQPSSAVIGLDVAIREVSTWHDIPSTRRCTMISALRFLGRVYGRPVESIQLDAHDITRQLHDISCVKLGIRPGSLALYRSCITMTMRRLGLIADPRRNTGSLTPAWAALRDGLSDQFLSIRLQQFIAWCDAHDFRGDQVSDATLMAYRQDIEANRIKGDPGDHARRVAKAWNRASAVMPGWPAVRLAVPSTVKRYRIAASDFPASLTEEIETMFARWAGTGGGSLYSMPGNRQRRPATIKTHRATLRAALCGAVHAGIPIESLRSLRDLVNPNAIQRVNDWHWNRAGQKLTDFTGQIAGLLALIARSHLRMVDAELKDILDATQPAKPKKRSRMTEKNEARLAQFDDPVILAQMLHLPQHLMKVADAMKGDGKQLEAAWLASAAVAVNIELHCPLRIDTLHKLRLGHEVVRIGTSKQRYTHFLINGDKTKNEALVRWPVNAGTSALIDHFVVHHRCLIGGAAGPYLFVARDRTDGPRDKSAMGTAITRAIKEHIGIQVNIHLFRAFAGVLIFENNSAGVEDLRQVLGHSTMETAMQYYTSRDSQRSAHRHNERVTQLTLRTQSTASAAFSGIKGKVKKSLRGGRP